MKRRTIKKETPKQSENDENEEMKEDVGGDDEEIEEEDDGFDYGNIISGIADDEVSTLSQRFAIKDKLEMDEKDDARSVPE